MAVVRKKLEGLWAVEVGVVVVDGFVCADFAFPFTEEVVAAGFLPDGVGVALGDDCGL